MGDGFLGGIGAAGGAVTTIIGAIGELFGGLLGGGGAAVTQLQASVSKLAGITLNSLQLTIRELGLIFGTGIIDLIRRLWGALKGLIGKLKQLAEDLKKLHDKLRALHDWYFKHFIGPVLQAIQAIRETLVVLRLFHVKWAQQLDSQLAGIENEIYTKFELAWTKINELISWSQLLTTSAGLLDPAVLLDSLKAIANPLRDLVGNLGSLGSFDPATLEDMNRDVHLFDQGVQKDREAVWLAGKIPDGFNFNFPL